jgi:hypothetical protein
MSKEDFLGLIQSDAFKLAIREANEPFRQEMIEFRDEVLTREDTTVRELKGMRQELALFGNRLTRVEENAHIH